MAGFSSFTSAGAPIYDEDGNCKSDINFISDIIHELLHSLRLPHPFDETISMDTELKKAGGENEYKSTTNTSDWILNNVMMYNYIIVDGKSFKDLYPNGAQLSLTIGQVKFMLEEIDRQSIKKPTKGESYWDESVSTPVN